MCDTVPDDTVAALEMARRFNATRWLLDRHIEEGRGDNLAVRCRGESLTYAELLGRVEGAACGLRAMGVRPEERVVLVMLDGVEFLAAFLGAMRIGAIPVPVNPLLPVADLAVIARDARAVLLVATESEKAVEIAAEVDEIRAVVLVDPPDSAKTTDVTVHSWDGAMSATEPVEPYDTVEDSPGFWLCTSGTTGHPKLAMHRHIDLRITAQSYAKGVLEITDSDRCYSVGPLFHAYGLGNSMTFPFSVGGVSILEPARPPTADLVADVVSAEAPTLFFCIPTFYAALLASDLPDDTFAPVRFGVSAAEPLPAEIWRNFRDRFGVEILDGIGSTEGLHIFISNFPGAVRPGSSGTVVPGYEARVVDDDGVTLPAGHEGHLLVKGESFATGYWCETYWSRRTFQGLWARTGDIYVESGDGYFTYLGRSDDMLRVSGEWVSPAEVEGILVEHPTVLEAAVVGENDELGLQRPVACVVPAPGSAIDSEELMTFCRDRLAGFKRPRRIITADELPKTATGKIQRFKLRQALPPNEV